tara:strand:- start:23150 stop:23734 length:585 start_codon:yes stop_codon:yes gene_type:complete
MKPNQAKKDKLARIVSQSPFSISPNYEATFGLNSFMGAFRDYNTEIEDADVGDWDALAMATPGFQRSNDKWSREMQVKFVENVVSGFRSKIQLYAISERDSYSNCQIMDGLQRSTSLCGWLQGDYPIFDDIYYPEVKSTMFSTGIGINFQIFNFQNELQAVDYYIAINENITHSPEDIARAKSYKQSLIEKMKN